MSLSRVLCVVGPTAVGKSAVADRVACELGGEVVSVDSMQVYRGMDVGTAKTPPEERLCPLHMVDVVDVNQPYSVQQFQHDARGCVDGIVARGGVPVLCGGTGLYLDAVIDEMVFPSGRTGGKNREAYEAVARERGPEALHAVLQGRDPKSAAQIHHNNVRRVVRALEMLDEGVSYADHHEGLLVRKRHYDARIWALSLDREELYRRIDTRVDRMFEDGLVEEVRSLSTSGLKESLTASQAIGYKEVLAALDGDITVEEARRLVKRNSRRYAKRQLSWIRRDGRARLIDLDEMSPGEAVSLIVGDWRTL